MKLIILLIHTFLLLNNLPNNPVYWDDFTVEERETVLSLKQVSPLVSDYYFGRITATDDDLTERLLDVLTTKQENNGVRALHFFLFNKILMSSDGALSEMLGPYAFKVVCEDPEYILSFLRRDKSLEECYVSSIGFELYLDRDNPAFKGLSMETLKSSIRKKTSNDKLTQPFLRKIEQKIEEYIGS